MRACEACGLSTSSYYYRPKRPQKTLQDKCITGQLSELAARMPRWGFKKMLPIVKAATGANHKRVYRLYTELGLNLRVKPRKRLPAGEASCLVQPLHPNHCWSVDFMSDVTRSGRVFRSLNVIDDYNRECLLIQPSVSLPAIAVIRYLDRIADERGYPHMIRVDNGPEFRATVFQQWAKQHHILVHYIQPGKPAQNAYIERFNRTYREEVLDCYLFDSLREVEEITEQWITVYNNQRPHEALNNLAPSVFANMRINNV